MEFSLQPEGFSETCCWDCGREESLVRVARRAYTVRATLTHCQGNRGCPYPSLLPG